MKFMRVMATMLRVKRARWVQGPSRPGRTAKHPCAIYLSGRARAAFLIKYIALCSKLTFTANRKAGFEMAFINAIN